MLHVKCFSLHVPLNFGGAVSKALDKINKSQNNAQLPKEEFMILSDCVSPWYTNVYVSVATETLDNATIEKMSGDFLGKVFEGEYSNVGKWTKEVEKLLPICEYWEQQRSKQILLLLSNMSQVRQEIWPELCCNFGGFVNALCCVF